MENSFLNDVGITIELFGFGLLIIRETVFGKRMKKRELTKKIHKKLLPIGIAVVIIGLILQLSGIPEYVANMTNFMNDLGNHLYEFLNFTTPET